MVKLKKKLNAPNGNRTGACYVMEKGFFVICINIIK